MLAFETVEKIESSALACTSVFLNVLVLDKIIDRHLTNVKFEGHS